MNAIISQKNINPLASIAKKLKMNSAYRGNKRRLDSDTVDSSNIFMDVERKSPRMNSGAKKSQISGTSAPSGKSLEMSTENGSNTVKMSEPINIDNGNTASSTLIAEMENPVQDDIIGEAPVQALSNSVGFGNVSDGETNETSHGESGSACSFDGLHDDVQGPTSAYIGNGESSSVGCENNEAMSRMPIDDDDLQNHPPGYSKAGADIGSRNMPYNLRRRPVPFPQVDARKRSKGVSSSVALEHDTAESATKRECHPKRVQVRKNATPARPANASLKECSLVIKRLTPTQIAEYTGKSDILEKARAGPNVHESNGAETDGGLKEHQDGKSRPVLIATKGRATRSELPRACKYIPLKRTQAGRTYSSGSETDDPLHKCSTISGTTRKRSHALETPPTVGGKKSLKINKNDKDQQRGKTQRYSGKGTHKNGDENGKIQKHQNAESTYSSEEADIKLKFAKAANKFISGMTTSAAAPTVPAVVPNITATPSKPTRLQASLFPMPPCHWRKQLCSKEMRDNYVYPLAGREVINDMIDLDPENIFDMEITRYDDMHTNGENKRNSVEMPNFNGNLLDGVQKLHSGGKANRRFGRKYSNFPYQYRNRVCQLKELFLDSPATAVGDEEKSAECDAHCETLPPTSTDKMDDVDSAIEDISDDGAPLSHNTRYVITQAVNDQSTFIRRARKFYLEITSEEISSSRRNLMQADKLPCSPLDLISDNAEPENMIPSAGGH